MRALILMLLVICGLFIALELFNRSLMNRFDLGTYTYEIGSNEISEQLVQAGIQKALARAAMQPQEWVPVDRLTLQPSTQSRAQVLDAWMTLTNRSRDTYYLYVEIHHTQTSSTIRYDIHRSK